MNRCTTERRKKQKDVWRFFLFFLAAYVIAAAETAWIDGVRLMGAVPFPTLVLCICQSLYQPPVFAVTTGTVCGLWMDFAKGMPFGLDCLLYTCISAGCIWLKKRFYFRKVYQVMLLVFCGVLLYGAAASWLYGRTRGVCSVSLLWGNAVYSMLIVPLFYAVIHRKEV